MPDPVDDDTSRLIATLREAASQAGLRRDDPIAPLVLAFIHTIKYLGEHTARSERLTTHVSRGFANAVRQSREVGEAEAKRFQAAFAKTEAEIIRRVATGIVDGAELAWARRLRSFNQTTVLLASFLLIAVAAGCLIWGTLWGKRLAYNTFRETEVDLAQAFIDGPETARSWRELMEWNDLRAAMLTCDPKKGRVHIQDGRRWCELPFWTEKLATPQQPRQ
jgi:hypothetical protein